MNNSKLIASVAVIAFFLGMCGAALAQEGQPNDQSQAPVQVQEQSSDQSQAQAQPLVARISYIHGQVSVQRSDTSDWIAATVNTPLEAGDSISTGPDSRAEVQMDYANVIRLGANSTAKFPTLDRSSIVVQAGQGLVNLDVLQQDNAQVEVDTPNMAVHPDGNGRYRIEVDSNDLTKASVWKGEADISTPQGSTRVENGQMITVQGTDNPEYQTSNAPGQDDWDRWNDERDRHIDSAQSWRYTDRYYTGSDDLDPYGHWTYAPDYGRVWQPNEPVGWAPYRDGRWVWEPYYGWTWVSYEPWGWAPYHYGRWFLNDDSWCWWPGPIAAYPDYYPIWAPAYVSFFGFGFGFGGGWSVGFGFGNIGWLPLGPADWFYPWYGAGFGISFVDFDRFHRGDWDRDDRFCFSPLFRGRGGFSNVDLATRDSRIRAGASWMSQNEFGRGSVPRQQREIDGSAFSRSRMFTGSLPVVPNRQSLQSTNHQPGKGTMRNGIDNQRFFSRGRPSPAQRSFHAQSFQAQQTQMQEMVQKYHAQPAAFSANSRVQNSRQLGTPAGGRSATPAESRSMAPSGVRSVTPSGGQQARQGWRIFNSTGQSTQGRGAWNEQGRQPSPAVRQSPSFGQTQSGRQMTPAPVQRQGNWRTFTPSTGRQVPSQPNQGMRQFPGTQRGMPAPAERQDNGRQFTPPARQQSSPRQSNPGGAKPGPGGHPNWQTFTPRSDQPRAAPPARGNSPASAQQRGGWSRFTPSSSPSSGQQGSRQPLNLRQPIVQPRQSNSGNKGTPHSYFGGGNSSYGARPSNGNSPYYSGGPSYRGGQTYGGGRAPSYNQPDWGGGGRGYSAPRGYSSPRGYSAPRNYGYSAPRAYSGSPRGYSAPRGSYGGGGRSYSAPRGGGGGGSRGGSSHGSGGGHPHHG